MKIEVFAEMLRDLGIETITGIPDSTLKVFCDYMQREGKNIFPYHVVPENEGAAVGIAIGEYLATGRPACVYMQNSGLGNAVNPLTSLAHMEVYGIPMLLMVGWRGEPGQKDEPQHKYMGEITPELLELIGIAYSVMTETTTAEELKQFLEAAGQAFEQNKQYALLIKKNTFQKSAAVFYENPYTLDREEAIHIITEWLEPEDLVVSTTGKISRELYEQSNLQIGSHKQAFLTVGGMGHANMIAFQIAKRQSNRRVICLDGDGALLMHMGGMAVIGANPADNLIHICLNNQAHESVGGMPTGAPDLRFHEYAEMAGYHRTAYADSRTALEQELKSVREKKVCTFLEIFVSLRSRADLGRPKETAENNKVSFMKTIGVMK